MACQRRNILPDFQIFLQRFFYFRTKVYNHFISAFSGNLDSVIFEIYILNVKTDTFRNTNTCSQQESDESEVAVLGFLVVDLFLSGKVIAAVFDIIKKQGNFIGFQADDAFLVDFRNVYQDRWIGMDHFPFEIIGIKAS